ncbi:MAG TPA: hypothetical protein VK162_10885 [Streptosporangiaceae bacterium]|nr:hypothetical protein [Streptosporangiaceae bacterium]
MLVVMVAMRGVAMPLVRVVDMVAVGDGLMPAAGLMSVGVAGMGQVRQRMLIVVAVMLGMGMTFVNVVDVTRTLDAGMPAAGSVIVRVGGMNLVLGGHCSSLL